MESSDFLQAMYKTLLAAVSNICKTERAHLES